MSWKRALLAWLPRSALAVAFLAVSVTPAGASTLADFEAGLPDGWFVFVGGGFVDGVPMVVPEADPGARPFQIGDNGILRIDFVVVDFGLFGASFETSGAQDWSATDGLSFWFYGQGSGLTYQAEISDNRSNPSIDTSERFDYTFTDDTFGWTRISIPWSSFTRATDFQPGGAPDDGFTLTEIWAWAIVLPQANDGVAFDDFGLESHVIDDFESGVAPATSCAGIPLGFCTFQTGVAIAAAVTPPAPGLFELGAPNTVIQVDLDVDTYAGFIHGFANTTGDTWVSQDWSAHEGLALWLYGSNSGTSMFIDLLENRNPGSTTDDAERWTVTLSDDFSGWRYVEFPFGGFTRKDVGNGAPDDGLTLDEVHGWAFGTRATPVPLHVYLDQVSLITNTGDSDGDGIPDVSDNCPEAQNPGQEDVGGVDTLAPDGIGDACQCGDANDNGLVQINDATIIKRAILGLGPGIAGPGKCNVIGTTDPGIIDPVLGRTSDCEINDATVIKRAILGLGPGIQQVCGPAVGVSP